MKMNSLSYGDAPQEVVYVVEYMMDLIESTLRTRPMYNKTLLVAMWPDMGMSLHGNNEEFVVGDYVASMSFGSRATMGFALDDKFSKGIVKGVDPIDVAVIPGCLEEKRQQIRERYDEGQLTRGEANEEMSTVVKGLKAPRGVRSDLSIPLPGTGAILVQWPSTLNDVFVHKVENHDGVRLVQRSRELSDKPGDQGKRHAQGKRGNTNRWSSRR